MSDSSKNPASPQDAPLQYENEDIIFLTLVDNVAFLKISRTCNNRCIFCCDTVFQNGGFMDTDLVMSKIIEGRKKKIPELFLTGGEPTIHPDFLKFVSLGKKLGYRKITCITNGRMFAYEQFAKKALKNGLSEIVFSINSLDPDVHNLLSGNKNAFEQAMKGLENIKAFGNILVQINTLVTKMNFTEMPAMAARLHDMGIHTWNVILVNPAGRSFPEHKEKLFVDHDELYPFFLDAVKAGKAGGLKMHFKKFPYNFFEDFEEYLTDPDNLFHEIREDQLRRNVYRGFIEELLSPECRGDRCAHCYLREFCDFLELFAQRYRQRKFPGIEGTIEEMEAHSELVGEIAGNNPELRLWIRAEKATDLKKKEEKVFSLSRNILIDSHDYLNLDELNIPHESQLSITVRDIKKLPDYLELKNVSAVVPVDKKTAGGILKNIDAFTGRERETTFLLENCEALREARAYTDLNEFFPRLPLEAASTSNIPPCITGRRPDVPLQDFLDLGVLGQSGINWGNFIRSYIKSQSHTKSRRCKRCEAFDDCRGIPVNYVRLYGYKSLRPLTGRSRNK